MKDTHRFDETPGPATKEDRPESNRALEFAHRRPARWLAWLCLFMLALGAPGPLTAQDGNAASEGFDQKTLIEEAEEFFGEGAQGLAQVFEKAFADYGRPNAYIKGEEVSGAVGVGVHYGEGTVTTVDGQSAKVHWQGPSLGFDVGAEAAKTFILVYALPDIETLYKRYPGVAGSLYFVAGVGMNYVRRDGTVLAPIRFGVGWRQGVNVGYMNFTRDRRILPL